MDSGGVDEVAGGGNHGNTSVFEFRGTHPEEGLVTSHGGEVEGIEVGDGGGGTTNVIKAKGELGTHGLCRNDRRSSNLVTIVKRTLCGKSYIKSFSTKREML